MLVMKFGGTSLGGAQSMGEVVRIVAEQRRDDEPVVVVCSAMAGVTDELIEMATMATAPYNSQLGMAGTHDAKFALLRDRHLGVVHALFVKEKRRDVLLLIEPLFQELHDVLRGLLLVRECTPRSLDLIMSFGERLSSMIVGELIREIEPATVFEDARAVIKTDSVFGSARVNIDESYRNILQTHAQALIRVVTGFIGSTNQGETTTLGRGGSDYTASLYGVALCAREIQIWTDVDGVLTADPRVIKNAKVIDEMSYEEAMEMSHFGAKVIYPPTMQPARDASIPIVIKNTFHSSGHGTRIKSIGQFDDLSVGSTGPVTGVSSIDQVAFMRVHGPGMLGVTGTAGRLFGALASAQVNIIMISQGSSEHSICFAIDPNSVERAERAIGDAFALEILQHKIDDIVVEDDVAIMAVIGERMRQTPGISGRLFGSLARVGVNVVAIAQGSSERNISIVVRRDHLPSAMESVHREFFWSDDQAHAFILGTGLIGTALLEQIKALPRPTVRVHGISNTSRMVLDGKKLPANLDEFIEHVIDAPYARKVFVDCTASAEPPQHYERLLENGVSVVTPNKRAASDSLDRYNRVRRAQNGHANFGYETNVGAGLPVIGTMRALLETGDIITKIEGVFSGTLSYLFNTYDGTSSFAELVAQARERGFTEPDPRDDLSGMDVARKLLILAREMGLSLDLADIDVENLCPKLAEQARTIDEFFTLLRDSDTAFSARAFEARSHGCVLRYLGRVEQGRASVQLEPVGASHPCFGLSGSDNLVSFTTNRYNDQPLVIRGPGAGAQVTAAGVLSDILSCRRS